MIRLTKEISLREPKLSDAKIFYKILINPKFKYFVRPKTLSVETKFMKRQIKKIKIKKEIAYTILYNGEIIGSAGIFINEITSFKGTIFYFIDEKYWHKGIATKVAKYLIKYAFEKRKLKRLELTTHPKNKASERIAKKLGFKKEGLLRKEGLSRKGLPEDRLMYARVK